MKYIDGFRDPGAARALRKRIETRGEALRRSGRSAVIMEVCGSHTMAIARYGIRDILPEGVDLVSGPGCPVCVTPPGYIDAAIDLAKRGATLVTFGDMLDVPGSEQTLSDCRAAGGAVEVCYGPAVAIDIARKNPERDVVFLAIGFETTVAPVVSLIPQAEKRTLKNLSLLTAFKRVPPALSALLADPEVRTDAFLCPAHVSAIIGSNAYRPYAGNGIPCVVAGFEPLDILLGVDGVLRQLIDGTAEVDNQYARVVRPDGNAKAQALIETYLEPIDAEWRAIGTIPASGYGIREEYRAYDAEARFGLEVGPGAIGPGCRCGDVIKGKLSPPACPLFAAACTPDHAVGPCMVSSEGTCAAYYKYSRLEEEGEGEMGS